MGVGKSWSRPYGEPELNEYDMPTEAYVPWLGKTVKDPTAYGIYFQERWDDALKADPPFIYLNDWNEWTAGKYHIDHTMWLGRENPFMFVDQYNAEFNRTIQPMKDGYTDNYYMQTVQNIRRYKGVRPIPENIGRKKIAVDGRFDDWATVDVSYFDTHGDNAHRDADGYAGLHYTDTTGRNDIVGAKVARDSKYVYFYVETAEKLTSSSDPHWMQLFIDIDRDKATGWNGYDFVVNRVSPKGSKAFLERNVQGIWMWDKATKVKFKNLGNALVICIPRTALGVGEGSLDFEFKWNDNMQEEGNIMDFYVSGDTAPGGRFNYVYTAD